MLKPPPNAEPRRFQQLPQLRIPDFREQDIEVGIQLLGYNARHGDRTSWDC